MLNRLPADFILSLLAVVLTVLIIRLRARLCRQNQTASQIAKRHKASSNASGRADFRFI